jgi:hypothetical protein
MFFSAILINMTDSKDDKPKYTIEIAPGAFDNFEGTQEELDELIADITRMAETGELMEQSEPLDLEELFEEDPEAALCLANDLGLFEGVVDEHGNDVSFEEIRDAMREERKRKLN